MRDEGLFSFQEEPGFTTAPLLLLLSGPADAGAVPSIIAASLLRQESTRLLGAFDSDRLFDYRSRRGVSTMSQGKLVDATLPGIALYEASTPGSQFFFVYGPEPDLGWMSFVASMERAAERLDVTKVVSVSGVPWPSPHTRPVGIFAYGDDTYLNACYPAPIDELTFPSSATSVLEVHLRSRTIPTVGIVAKVPQYISSVEYPKAAAAVAVAVDTAVGVQLPPPPGDPTEVDRRLAEQMQNFAPLAALVTALETAHDSEDRSPVSPEGMGEDLVAQIQDYLSGL